MIRSFVLSDKKTVFLLLKISLTAFVAGIIYQLFTGTSPVNNYLFIRRGWQETQIVYLEYAIIVFLIISLLLVFWGHYWGTVLMVPVFVIMSYLSYVNGGKPLILFSFIGSIVRSLFPLSIPLNAFYYFNQKKEQGDPYWLILLLKVSLSLLFASHGIAALRLHPVFIDYLIGSGYFLTGAYMQEEFAINILRIIGWVDLIVAILILFYNGKWLLIWMVIWTCLTTLLRITEGGLFNYPEFLIRIPHIGLALVYYLLQISFVTVSKKVP